ncbi:UNKNOWN [Stylonychia lemnae]|uniref:Uncharacterized protein n=1 Tax=Stylonychia lemnae TaxID=5949 RepID=A0A078ARD2_STYLE|nr:UNKNOWN [Stylonychia lemnae]|eukprot:CDW84541.1 UNKNOWN [Stylonychia lemnae]
MIAPKGVLVHQLAKAQKPQFSHFNIQFDKQLCQSMAFDQPVTDDQMRVFAGQKDDESMNNDDNPQVSRSPMIQDSIIQVNNDLSKLTPSKRSANSSVKSKKPSESQVINKSKPKIMGGNVGYQPKILAQVINSSGSSSVSKQMEMLNQQMDIPLIDEHIGQADESESSIRLYNQDNAVINQSQYTNNNKQYQNETQNNNNNSISNDTQRLKKIEIIKKLYEIKKCVQIKRLMAQKESLYHSDISEVDAACKVILEYGRLFIFQNMRKACDFDKLSQEQLLKLKLDEKIKEYNNYYLNDKDFIMNTNSNSYSVDQQKQARVLEKLILSSINVQVQQQGGKDQQKKMLLEQHMVAEDLFQKKIDNPEFTPVKDIDDKFKRYTYERGNRLNKINHMNLSTPATNKSKRATTSINANKPNMISLGKRAMKDSALQEKLQESSIQLKRQKMKQHMNLSKLENRKGNQGPQLTINRTNKQGLTIVNKRLINTDVNFTEENVNGRSQQSDSECQMIELD